MSIHTFTAFFPFCGLGAGARGFVRTFTQLGQDRARFLNLGGVDSDAEACADFEYLTGAPALQADLHTLRTDELISWLERKHGRKAARRRPDCVFLSPPCKGFSRLLSTAASLTPEYQELNRLVYEGLFLMMEAWAPQRPPMVVLENVPGIQQRGAELLDRVYRMLGNYGYVFHRATHDCGVVGGLAQHRKRFLLVARDPKQVGAYVYQPPKKRVKGCGEVLVELPLPGDEEAGGLLHRLPNVEWITAVRLAHIPPGGDWRDLPRKLGPAAENPGRHHAKFRVEDVQAPAHAVTGATKPADGAPSVADPLGASIAAVAAREHGGGLPLPRLYTCACGTTFRDRGYVDEVPGLEGARSPCPDCGGTDGSWGPPPPGDPRFEDADDSRTAEEYRGRSGQLALGHEPRRGTMGVIDSADPAPTVRGRADVRTGPAAIADAGSVLAVTHREGRHTSQYRMGEWQEPARTVTGCTDVQEGAQLVAEPLEAVRKAWEQEGVKLPGLDAAWFKGKYKVDGWDGPTRAVIGGPGNGAEFVAQPLQLGATAENAGNFAGRPGLMGVQAWEEPAPAVIGRASVSGGHATAAVAEPFGNVMRVLREDEPAGTVTHSPSPTSGAPAVADSGFSGKLGVAAWEEPAATVKGESYPTNGGGAVAEPFKHVMRVLEFDQPAGAVTSATGPTNGAASVAQPLITGPSVGDPASFADPRLFSPLAPGQERRAIMGRYRVLDWRQPSPGVTGPGTNSVYGIADSRALALACSPRAGVYGVLSWQQAAATITGTARVDNGPFAVADPRPGEPGWRPPKGLIIVIVSQWNCWHRPLTTLELAVLQSIPWMIRGRPLELAGNSVARKRERIGNAVPVQAAAAVARSVLKALLASALGCWHLSGGDGLEVWVRSDGRPEDDFPDLDPPAQECLPT